MYTLKGFAQISALIDNTLTVVAPVGEMPPYGSTFAREQTSHTSTDHPGVELVTFTSKRDTVQITPPEDYVLSVLEVTRWVYLQAAAGRFSQNADNFQNQFIAQFGLTVDLLDSGLMTRGDDLWCPAFIDISFTGEGLEENRSKIWFAGDAFVNQYDDFEILVVPPLENLDDFFKGLTQVKGLLGAMTVPKLMEKVQSIKDGYPDTTVVTNTFEWTDSNNTALKLDVDWTVIIYGAAGDNLDNIKEAIIDFVLANSERPREDWELIFPDIFTATEFIITPMWSHYSVPNQQLVSGLYSPVVPVKDALAITKITCKGKGYTPEYVDNILQLAASAYKSVSLAIVGGPKNRDGINRFNDQFKDYLAVPSTHLDFQRMDPLTREFVITLAGMLKFAEELTPTSAIPREHTRTHREGIYYLSKTIGRVQYLVVTKYTLNDQTTGIAQVLADNDGHILTDGESVLIES